jgi:hypothetical protein
MLRLALSRGWPPLALEAEARNRRGPKRKRYKRLYAIHDATTRRYYTPEERAADLAWLQEIENAEKARDAIKATRATRPKAPQEYKAIGAACRSMLDCDRLSSALEAGWRASDINLLARAFSVIASRVPNKETPASIRFALSMIEGRPAGHYPPFLP